jgi:2,4-dienoyl-CoA reductase-like NADH-dependent reductase (Old Yellow Enzyme family)
MHFGDETLLADIRRSWSQDLIVNRPGRPLDKVGADITAGLADIESYGQFVLSNPDFLDRLKQGAAMNSADRATYFGGAEGGYLDYPTLADGRAA